MSAGLPLAHGDPNKPVTVTAGAEALSAWVRVHNEGPPIPQELQSALFNPFRMGERSSRSPAGLGLGLYISNEVIVRHGGQIEVRSTAVDGTTFRVVLPREALGNSGDRGSDPSFGSASQSKAVAPRPEGRRRTGLRERAGDLHVLMCLSNVGRWRNVAQRFWRSSGS